MGKAVELEKEIIENRSLKGKLVKELEKGIAILVYDLPYPKYENREEQKKYRPWLSWYDWSTYRLRLLGYPLQYSVVLIDESRIPQVEEVRKKINEKRENLNKAFGYDIPEPQINVICFNFASRQDAETMLAIIREGLKSTLEAFIEDIEKKLEELEGQSLDDKERELKKSRLFNRVKEFVKKLKSQDFLDLLIRDSELRNLLLQLEILTA